MRPLRRLLPPQFGHAARVAAAATLVIAVVYLGSVTALDLAVAARLTGQTDAHLDERLSEARRNLLAITQSKDRDDDNDVDTAPVFLWLAGPGGRAERLARGEPALPGTVRPGRGWPRTLSIGTRTFRLDAEKTGSGWLVAGQSLAADMHTRRVLIGSEIAAGPLLLLAMFLGSLTVGLKALAPVEQSRRRQLEFTADASHELRTPLSVISAEADVAVGSPRTAAGYQGSLARIQGESRRLRRIVEDLLWLARFDSQPPPPGDEPVDVGTIAEVCADRFRPVGQARSVTVEAAAGGTRPALISAPPEWVDRLAGVLMDNACRYAGEGGQVRIGVTAAAGRVSLIVEDSGPGIPDSERPRLFDRFHRATAEGQGAGLGLAIADSVGRSTGGRWSIGGSARLGGARMEVSWRQTRRLPPGLRPGSSPARPGADPAVPG